jgi:WKF domain
MVNTSKNNNSANRKKRVSKHVLKSRQGKKRVEEGGDDVPATNDVAANVIGSGNSGGTGSPQSSAERGGDSGAKAEALPSADHARRRRKRKTISQMKDPGEAASYLKAWKASKTGITTDGATPLGGPADAWKFNKNTQSWLIRHMYEFDKVPKGTFSILQEYLKGLEGTLTKERIRTEATWRARRYKEHCNAKQKDGITEESGDGHNPDCGGEKEHVNTTPREKSNVRDPAVSSKEEIEEEETRWINLDEREKRKEYKRARILLDLLKEAK